MREAGRRPLGRLSYWARVYWVLTEVVAASLGLGLAAWGVPVPQSGPPTTTIAEVRLHDYGWGVANDRNLLGRFNTETFSLPRLAKAQNYFLRLYDASSPPRYSRYAACLHVDYPL